LKAKKLTEYNKAKIAEIKLEQVTLKLQRSFAAQPKPLGELQSLDIRENIQIITRKFISKFTLYFGVSI